MKKLLLLLFAAAIVSHCASAARAQEKPKNEKKDPDAPRTIRGVGLCTKCELKESEKCQAVIQVKAKTKQSEEITRTFYVADNEVAKGAHKEFFCSGKHPVVAMGTVKREGRGQQAKLHFTATEIKAGKEQAGNRKGKGAKKEKKD